MGSKFKSKTSWRSKLEKAQEPSVFEMTGKTAQRFGPGKMLIPTPMMVDEVIRRVRRGKLITTGTIRKILAEKMGADVTCPLCTGIFVRISAEASEEDRAAGRSRVTPYWRVVTDKGELNEKFSGGTSAAAQKLREEGHRVAMKGKKLVVVGFEKAAQQPVSIVAAA
jgi:alkylated DNA nucleotide flippase Atl1